MKKTPILTNNIKTKREDEMFMPESFTPEFQKTLDTLKHARKWEELVSYLKPLADKYSEEYFIMSELANAYCCLDKAEDALFYAQLAYEIERHDIIVLFSLGWAYVENKMYPEAIDFFNRILRKRVKDVAYGPHGEGMRWALSFHIDAFYWKAICVMEMGDYKEALRLINLHLRKRMRGVYSDFKKRRILKRKALVESKLKSNT